MIPTGAVQRGPNGTFVYVDQGRRHGGDAADRGPETGRDADGRKERCGAERARGHHRIRPPHRRQQSFDRQRQRAGRRRKARGHATDSKRQRAAATIRGRTRSNERIVPIHSPADRHFPARRRGDAGRIPRLLVAAGFCAAASRFPNHSGHHATARCQSRHHRRAGDRTAGAAIRPDPGTADHDVVELVRHQPGHAAIRPQSRHRRCRAGRAVGDQCRRLHAAAQPALPAALFEGEPG